ncbi:MAG: site-specific DNA-methyltransferase [Halanaeroarchaeum sp.]
MSESERPAPLLLQADAASLPIEDESVDVIVTSPPYNIGNRRWKTEWEATRRTGVLSHGAAREERYRVWQQRVLSECYRVASDGASLFYVHTVRISDGELMHPVEWLKSDENPWLLRQEIVWDHGISSTRDATLFRPGDERIYWLTKGQPDLPWGGIDMDSVWDFDPSRSETRHPAPYPPQLVKKCLRAVGTEGDVVLDPMGGSMTTCTAAADMGYRSIGVDVNREFILED